MSYYTRSALTPAKNISSIRRFLIVSLLGLLTAIIILLTLLNYIQLVQQNQHIFRMQLVDSAQVLDAFTSIRSLDEGGNVTAELTEPDYKTIRQLLHNKDLNSSSNYIRYRSNLVFQIWDTDNSTLLMKSPNAPNVPMNMLSYGFSDAHDADGTSWHSFSLTNNQSHRRIIIGVQNTYIHSVNVNLFLHDLAILIVMYFFIAIVVLAIVEIGLAPVKRIAAEVSERHAHNLTPFDPTEAPVEILPLLIELNKLFRRVETTLEREKRFAADAAHELRTPLAALKTQVEVAIREKNKDERVRILNNIIDGTNRFAHVVEQLLTLSRLEPDSNYQMRPLDLNTAAQTVAADLAPIAIKKHIELELHIGQSPITINANETAIGILIRNLLENAIRYTPSKGHVSLNISHSKTSATIQVIDTGPGVPLEMRERIFDRFYRQIGNTVKGSGLGLSIAKRIVDIHEGTIVAKTPANGKGLEMRVDFPLAK